MTWIAVDTVRRLEALSDTLGLSKSEVMRRAVGLLEHAIGLTVAAPPNERFAPKKSKRQGSAPPRDQLILELRALAEALGRSPSVDEWNAQEGRSCNNKTVNRVVGGGTWTGALAAAGLSEPRNGRARKWGRDDMIRLLQEWHQRHGRAPTQQGWDSTRTHKHPSEATIRGVFGSWTGALEAAGLPTERSVESRWSSEVLLGYLRDWYKARGDAPTQAGWDAARKPGFPSEAVFRQRFGSWNKALKAAGLPERNPHTQKGHRQERNRQMVTAGRKGAGPVRWDRDADVEQINTKAV